MKRRCTGTPVFFSVIVFALTGELVIGRAENSMVDSFDVTLKKPVDVQPPFATCGMSQSDVSITYSRGLFSIKGCLSSCAGNRSIDDGFLRLFESKALGDKACYLSGLSSEGRYRRRLLAIAEPQQRSFCSGGCLCYKNFIISPRLTYSMWFKQEQGSLNSATLVSALRFEVELFRNQTSSGIKIYTGVKTEFFKIDIQQGVWNLLTVRVTIIEELDSIVLYVSLNDTLFEPILRPITVYITGFYTLDVGIAHNSILSLRCSLLDVSECLAVGHSPAVRLAPFEEGDTGALPTLNQTALYAGLWRAFGLAECPWQVDTLRRFACAASLPACNRDSSVRLPCGSLCKQVHSNCKMYISEGESDALEKQCAEYETIVDNCVDIDNSPAFGMFKGLVEDGRYYNRSLSNREAIALYTGRLSSLRILPECVCDTEHPFVDKTNEWQCNGYGEQQKPTNRLSFGKGAGYSFSLPEFINDGSLQTFWATRFDLQRIGVKSVSVSIDFQRQVQMLSLKLNLASGYPTGIIVSARRGSTYEIIQYLAANCSTFGPAVLTDDLPSVESVNCQRFDRLDSNPKGRSPIINLNFYDGRPGYNPDTWTLSTELQRFLTYRAIRLEFLVVNVFVQEMRVLARPWCNCYAGGTVAGTTCDADEQCQCKQLPGRDIALAGKTCELYVLPFAPSYGPEAGGTVIQIGGGYFEPNGSLLVETDLFSEQLQVLSNTQTTISVTTLPLNSSRSSRNLLNKPTALRLRLQSGVQIRTRDEFTFKPNPVVKTITPRKTFVRGGIMQTVVGRHLDSVAFPEMFITILFYSDARRSNTTNDSGGSIRNLDLCKIQEDRWTSISLDFAILYDHQSGIPAKNDIIREDQPVPVECKVANSTVMYCRTPYLDDIPLSSRRRRQTVLSRARRAPPDGFINKPYRQFYIGLKFDGFQRYLNVSETLPLEGILYVYDNPEIDRFDGVRVFRTYSPHNDQNLLITGKRLDFGCQASDYTITIGEGVCELTSLLTNEIICSPPQTQPAVGKYNANGAHRVMVFVGHISVVLGHLRYEERLTDSFAFRVGMAVAISCLVIVALVVAGVCWHRRRRRRRKTKRQQAAMSSAAPNPYIAMQATAPRLIDQLDGMLRQKIDKVLVDKDRMIIGAVIGQGNFGKVHEGKLLGGPNGKVKVAIKTLKDAGSTEGVSEFLLEATIMQDFSHANVLSLLAVVIDDVTPYVIMPLMENGDLRALVSNHSLKFTLRDILGFGYDVAKGMSYLATARFVHRDLAARNCLVDAARLVKIADFGLARDIYEKDYYRIEDRLRPMPVKWMALESLQSQTFTTQSDVWAYGVLLWELLTRGIKPYAHIDNMDLKRFLVLGRRLQKPPVTPDEIYEIMLSCWRVEPTDRPSFDDIRHQLASLLGERMPGATAPPSPPHDYLVLVE